MLTRFILRNEKIFKVFRTTLLYVVCFALPIASGFALEAMHQTARVTAAMVFLLEVLAISALGRSPLAIVTSLSASLTFSYNFLPPVGSFAVSMPDNLTALVAFVVTAVTGSQLSVRAQRRAVEANLRRDEMERLQQFSSSLLAADSLVSAATAIPIAAISHFGFTGVELNLHGEPPTRAAQRFSSGLLRREHGGMENTVLLDTLAGADLRLFGAMLTEESQRAFGNVVSLILDRAQGAEDRFRLEAEQRSDELHTTVLNALAHNFRTPLTSIKMAASTLLTAANNQIPHAPERDLLLAIDEEADRLQALIRESLEFARLESHRNRQNDEPVDVKQLIESVCAKVQRFVQIDRIEFSFDQDLPGLRGDRLLFEQMLFQVVDNAWKYSSPSAKIWISARLDWTYLILTVQNEGPPVPEQDKERIFERFVRGGVSRTKIEGTGLGLAIARTIAQSYGGRLWLDQEVHGPAFRFAIPIGS